ncbi:hypothetical protein EI94DRAFT_1855746 [Lactarius quietus]|nr:hypothetical protein EI94DRAFT_1855746 [Lactarius quietus]
MTPQHGTMVQIIAPPKMTLMRLPTRNLILQRPVCMLTMWLLLKTPPGPTVKMLLIQRMMKGTQIQQVPSCQFTGSSDSRFQFVWVLIVDDFTCGCDKLGLFYQTPKVLNDIIDQELPGRLPFKCHDLVIGGDTLQLYFWDILQCIRSLFGDPEFARDMASTPECHYTDHQWSGHVYSEMNTGNWWWAVQKLMAPIAACSEIGVTMKSGNGIWHHCHPILATFVGDYLEQALVTCTYQGWCQKCLVEPNKLGDYSRSPP